MALFIFIIREKRKTALFSFLPNIAEIGYIYIFPFRFFEMLFGEKKSDSLRIKKGP